MRDLLVVIDYQNDFVDGALGFAGAEALEPGILAAVQRQLDAGGCVLFTRDTHPVAYADTREGRFLPVPHCVAGTPGHQLYGELHRYETEVVPHTLVIDKPGFGSLDIAEQAHALCGGAPDRITLCGVVTDICVVTNALLLHTAFQQAEVAVDSRLCGSGNTANAAKALDLLRGMGIGVLE